MSQSRRGKNLIWSRWFVVFVSVALGVLTTFFVSTRIETLVRREQFCKNENKDSLADRKLWDEIILESQKQPQRSYVEINGVRYPVIEPKITPEQEKIFKKIIADANPLTEC